MRICIELPLLPLLLCMLCLLILQKLQGKVTLCRMSVGVCGRADEAVCEGLA